VLAAANKRKRKVKASQHTRMSSGGRVRDRAVIERMPPSSRENKSIIHGSNKYSSMKLYTTATLLLLCVASYANAQEETQPDSFNFYDEINDIHDKEEEEGDNDNDDDEEEDKWWYWLYLFLSSRTREAICIGTISLLFVMVLICHLSKSISVSRRLRRLEEAQQRRHQMYLDSHNAAGGHYSKLEPLLGKNLDESENEEEDEEEVRFVENESIEEEKSVLPPLDIAW